MCNCIGHLFLTFVHNFSDYGDFTRIMALYKLYYLLTSVLVRQHPHWNSVHLEALWNLDRPDQFALRLTYLLLVCHSLLSGRSSQPLRRIVVMRKLGAGVMGCLFSRDASPGRILPCAQCCHFECWAPPTSCTSYRPVFEYHCKDFSKKSVVMNQWKENFDKTHRTALYVITLIIQYHAEMEPGLRVTGYRSDPVFTPFWVLTCAFIVALFLQSN